MSGLRDRLSGGSNSGDGRARGGRCCVRWKLGGGGGGSFSAGITR